eukprot:g13898.t1
MALGTWRVNLDDNKKFQAAKRKHFIALMGNAHFQSLFHKTRRITLLEARVDERFATALEPFLAEVEEQPQQDQAAGKDNERKKKGQRDQKNMNFWIPGLPGVAYPVVDAGDDTLEELPVLAELRALGPLNVSSLLAVGAGSGASTPASSTSNSIFPVLDAGRVKSGCNAAVLPDFCAHLSRMKFRHEISTYTFEPTALRLIKSGAWSEVREGSSASAECPSNTGLLIVYNGGAANEPALDLVSPEAGGEDVRIPPGRGAVVDDCRFPGLRVAPSSAAPSGGNTKNPNALVPVLFVRMWHPLVPPSERVRQATLLLEQRVPPKDVEKMQKAIMRLGRERWGEVARTWLQREKGTILTEESLQAGRSVYFRSDNGPRPDLEAGVAEVGGRDEL